jgi:hypothetical protein
VNHVSPASLVWVTFAVVGLSTVAALAGITISLTVSRTSENAIKVAVAEFLNRFLVMIVAPY